jgi:hypothetical protein
MVMFDLVGAIMLLSDYCKDTFDRSVAQKGRRNTISQIDAMLYSFSRTIAVKYGIS